jgi:hypothetical protein
MKKTFAIEVVLGLTTGVLLKRGGFGEIHELAEHVAGHSIWTHEFADKRVWSELSEKLFAQHPRLRDAEQFAKPEPGALGNYLAEYVARAVATFGASLEIEGGTEARTESPLQSLERLAPGKPAVILVAK